MVHWIAKRYRFERELLRLNIKDTRMLRNPGRLLTQDEIMGAGLESALTERAVRTVGADESLIGKPIPWRTEWGSRAPLSYQCELSEGRFRRARELAGIKHPDRSQFDNLAIGCIVGLYSGLGGAIVGATTGFLLSDNYPILGAVGGAFAGLVGAPSALALGTYTRLKMLNRLYNKTIDNHEHKIKSRMLHRRKSKGS